MIVVLFLGMTYRTPISMCVWSLSLLCINIALASVVKNNADSRELDNGKVWAVMSFFFSLPVVGLYFLMNKGLGVKPSDKGEKTVQRNAVIMCAVALIISVAITPLFVYENKQAKLRTEYEEAYKMPYLNAEGTHYVLYDKMGNEYAYDEICIPLYTKDGKKYEDEGNYFQSSSGVLDLAHVRVDSEGYLAHGDYAKMKEIGIPDYDFEDDYYYVVKDGKGNYFYKPDDCSWDKNGNLVFRSQELTDFYNKNK